MAKNSRHGQKAERELVNQPQFLYAVGTTIGALGVVGEERNRLAVFLAGISKELDEPVSLIVKGPSSSGKSNLLRTVLRIFPPEVVVERTSLSGKAPAYTDESWEKRILFLHEYRGGKEAQLLIRLLQSEGRIAHEATAITSQDTGTRVEQKQGMPVVLTTTTEEEIFQDDDNRALTLHMDQSAQQTLAIAKARVQRIHPSVVPRLDVWQRAVGMITRREGDFERPPGWLKFVAENLPLEQVRVRRDWGRFLSLCQAVALCRRGFGREPVNIKFADYAVAYAIVEPALAATARVIHPREAELLSAIETLSGEFRRGVTPKSIADHLKWERSLVYKYLEEAAKHKRIEYKAGTRERNQKLVILAQGARTGFLVPPLTVLQNRTELPKALGFVDPFTGKKKVLKRV